MKIGKTLTLVLIASMLLSIAMMSPVSGQGTTIGVEPEITTTGSTFTVEIWIRNVADIKGFEFKLAYDTTVLTATEIEYGGIFGPSVLVFPPILNDEEGMIGYAVMMPVGSFSGDGRAAIIHFTVDGPGISVLDLYDSKLANSEADPITHTREDGYFGPYPLPLVEYWAKLVNVKKKHMDVCTTQTITGLITNKGEEGGYVRAKFAILDAATGTPVDIATSDALWIGAGADVKVTAEWHVGTPGSYYVKGVIELSCDGINFVNYDSLMGIESEIIPIPGGLGLFRVVGPSWFKAA